MSFTNNNQIYRRVAVDYINQRGAQNGLPYSIYVSEETGNLMCIIFHFHLIAFPYPVFLKMSLSLTPLFALDRKLGSPNHLSSIPFFPAKLTSYTSIK